MDRLLKKYSPIGLAEILRYMQDGRPLPERVFLLTFDDGYREMSVSGDVWANKPYLTSKQITGLLDSGFTIGAHSVDQPDYSELSFADQVRQTIDSFKFVRETFHLKYGVFAFPFSDYGISKDFF